MNKEIIETSTHDKCKIKLTIFAVLFGCDDSFINIDLGKGLKIIRYSLTPEHDLEILDLSDIGLRQEYEAARIDKSTLDVACVFGEITDNFDDIKSAHRYFREYVNDVSIYLDNQIRAIRLLIEGPFRFKKLVIKMSIENNEPGLPVSFNATIPIGEAYHVRTIQKAHCENIGLLQSELNMVKLPNNLNYVNQAHLLYDRSYLVTLPEAEILLICALEVLFLKSENCKKEKLSKRCATFLAESEVERNTTYQKLRLEYQNRSNFIHEGDPSRVTTEGIVYLRKLVRDCILRLNVSKKDKNELISELKAEVQKFVWKEL